MSDPTVHNDESLIDRLADGGYWVARAARCLREGKFSEVVALCRENLKHSPRLVSGRLLYATALYKSGQAESATEEFHRVLALDPENLVALKYLGDIKYAAGDQTSAVANYHRILEIDPDCRGLQSRIEKPKTTTTRTITLSRGAESAPKREPQALREIPFYTETMGDLYLSQGYPRLAAEVFRRLGERGESPRIAEKLAQAESKMKEKES